jgi:hypothetical protein
MEDHDGQPTRFIALGEKSLSLRVFPSQNQLSVVNV